MKGSWLWLAVFAALVSSCSISNSSGKALTHSEQVELSTQENLTGVPYLERQDVQHFIEELVHKDGFEREWVEDVLGNATHKAFIIRLLDRTPEGTWDWAKYSKHLLDTQRIEGGIKFYTENRALFDQAEEEYGVPGEIMAAILGVETRYGTIMGSTRILDALVTIGFDYPRRASYFRKELRHFLLMSLEERMDPKAIKGSYAGAMGYGQFMPSSYRNLAVDYNDDGVRNLFDPVDAIGSIGHYLKENGWRAEEAIMEQATLVTDIIDDETVNASVNKIRGNPKYTRNFLRTWFEMEYDENPVELSLQGYLIAEDTKQSVFRYEGVDGTEYWLSHHNFHVIGRYNISRLYSMAVFQLSQKIKAGAR